MELMITSDKIKKQAKSLSERGLHDNSYFEAVFKDGSRVREHETNWHDMSERKRVKYQAGTKTVMVSTHPIHRISIKHNNHTVTVDIPSGHEVYQGIRSETMFIPSRDKQTRIVGRFVGLVKDDEVIEEIFINGLQDVTLGWKK